MIFIVEPGGCSPENGIPAKARIWPLRGRTATTPPRRPASAAIAARSTEGEMVVRTAAAGVGGLQLDRPVDAAEHARVDVDRDGERAVAAVAHAVDLPSVRGRGGRHRVARVGAAERRVRKAPARVRAEVTVHAGEVAAAPRAAEGPGRLLCLALVRRPADEAGTERHRPGCDERL